MKVAAGIVLCLAIAACQGEPAPETKQGCFTNNVAISGGDILVAGFHNLQESADDCQTSCQAITNCQYFTYFTASAASGAKYCTLKYENNNILPLDDTVSGPRNC